MGRSLAPIVLFAYNRREHLEQTVLSLQANYLAQESELVVFSDGPKSRNDENKVAEVRLFLRGIQGFKSVSVVERKSNFGLAASIVDGVSQIVKKSGKVIVLEDDIVTSPYFLNYMNDALDFYQDDPDVWHISGFSPDIGQDVPEHYFIMPTTCWGWGTWSGRWQYLNMDVQTLIKEVSGKSKKIFNYAGVDYYSHLLMNASGKMQTWAVFWYATCYLNHGFSLHPRESFSANIGHDGSGENCNENQAYQVKLAESYDGVFPHAVHEKPWIKKRYIKFYRLKKLRTLKTIMSRFFHGFFSEE